MEFEEIQEVFDSVAEMSTDAVGGMVPLNPALVSEITEGDDDPRFATFVIESGWSKANRYWGGELFGEVATEMNSAAAGEPIVGYMGHIKPDDDGYSFPEIQLQWVGAKLLQTGEKAKLAVKAYVLPGTKGREYLRRGLVKTVSWRGKAAQVPFQKGVRVNKFQIESIDLSRPRKAGMSARLVGALTSEMEGDEKVKPEEIAALQENELRAHNPQLVATIEDSAKAPLSTKVQEMEDNAKETRKVLEFLPQLRTILGLEDNADNATVLQAGISKLKAEAKTLRETILDSVLAKRFKDADKNDLALMRRILVSEMASKDVKLTGSEDDDFKTVSEMVTEIIDGDSALKETVAEMEQAPANLPNTGTNEMVGGTGTTKYEPGVNTGNVRVKARV